MGYVNQMDLGPLKRGRSGFTQAMRNLARITLKCGSVSVSSTLVFQWVRKKNCLSVFSSLPPSPRYLSHPHQLFFFFPPFFSYSFPPTFFFFFFFLTMTNTRRTSRSKAAADSSANTDLETLSQDSIPEGSSATATAVENNDSTHQAVESAHIKQDQKLEASDDPDVMPATQDPATMESIIEAASTPTHLDIQEGTLSSSGGGAAGLLDHKEPLMSKHHEVVDVDALEHHHHGSSKAPDEVILVEEEEEVTTTTTRTNDGDAPVSETMSSMTHGHGEHVDPSQVPLPPSSPMEGNELGTTKHAKRAVDEDSNTLAEEQHDYSAGVYKSPFRHAHKAERAGKEER